MSFSQDSSVTVADVPFEGSSRRSSSRRSGAERAFGKVRSARSGVVVDDPTSGVGNDAGIARLILVNGPPASGKSTLARRYADDHDGAALVEIDALRMTLPNWAQDEATRLVARELAGAAVVESLRAGSDVIMAQYLGRLGYVVVLDELARAHGATFVEVILAADAALAIDRFLTRRRAMIERGECHPERDIADADVGAFIGDAVDRLARLSTARPESRMVPVALGASEDEIYRRLLVALGEVPRPSLRSLSK